jgi:hypothetical protein
MGGDWQKPKGIVQPHFPAFLGQVTPDLKSPKGTRSTGRRAALARWLTRPDHPLTARVIVNRLWQHHFGVGLVATPSDFGVQGATPSHPELLDWLAVELIESAWNLKHLHRLMVTSEAYCQDSVERPGNRDSARAVDPENRLLWQARRRRLDGEALRDALLTAAGDLNRRMGGASARPILPADFTRYSWKPDPQPEDRNRRSVYVVARRNVREPLIDVFDLPDRFNSCACRPATTTAPQALALLNGSLTTVQAERWAADLQRRLTDDRTRLADAYRTAWGRPATSAELLLGERFLKAQAVRHGARGKGSGPARAAALADFCHTLFNTNEFLYID